MSASLRKSVTMCFVAVLLACLFSVGLSQLPSEHSIAHADGFPYTAGVQILYTCNGDQLWDTYVYGHNQNGDYAAWKGSGNGGNVVSTPDWWWIGDVHIDSWDSTQNRWQHSDDTAQRYSFQGSTSMHC